jgi:hypothetical protein
VNKPLVFFTGCALIFSLLLSGCRDDLRNIDCANVSASYTNDIRPIVNANCNSSGCHNAGSSNGDFTTYAGLKAKADDGSLDQRVNIRKDMPKNGSLSKADRSKIRCWINNGAPQN